MNNNRKKLTKQIKGFTVSIEKISMRKVRIGKIGFCCQNNRKLFDPTQDKPLINPINWGDYSPGSKRKIIVKSAKRLNAIKKYAHIFNNGEKYDKVANKTSCKKK